MWSSTLRRIVALAFLTATFFFIAPPAQAQTRSWEGGVCVGTGNASDVATIQGLQCLIANVLSVALTLIGLAGFIMIVMGAFRLMLSGDSTKGVEEARKTITFAVVGLVVALSAFIILNLLSAFTGINLTNFVIPNSDFATQDDILNQP